MLPSIFRKCRSSATVIFQVLRCYNYLLLNECNDLFTCHVFSAFVYFSFCFRGERFNFGYILKALTLISVWILHIKHNTFRSFRKKRSKHFFHKDQNYLARSNVPLTQLSRNLPPSLMRLLWMYNEKDVQEISQCWFHLFNWSYFITTSTT